MKERPILFSTDMVKAILDGRKTMTRRTVKPQPPFPSQGMAMRINNHGNHVWDYIYGKWFEGVGKKCPYGQPRDVLWVREPFFLHNEEEYIYLADGNCCQQFEQCPCTEIGKPKWKPSIHMPRSAARLFLKVTDVRVERLQAISEEDAIAEGIEMDDDGCRCRDYILNDVRFIDPVQSFESLWRSINGPGSWDLNPFVWVISFEKI